MSQLSENENDTVAFKVTVNGKESSQADTQGLESIHVEDHLEKMGTCTLEFSLGGMDWSNFSMGNEVVVEIEGGDSKTHFVGYVTSIRHTWKAGQEYCTLEAMDPLCKMAATRNTKKWEKMKDSAIATELISSSSCKPGTIDPSSITEDYTFQRNESNLSIAKRLAARNGFRISAKA